MSNKQPPIYRYIAAPDPLLPAERSVEFKADYARTYGDEVDLHLGDPEDRRDDDPLVKSMRIVWPKGVKATSRYAIKLALECDEHLARSGSVSVWLDPNDDIIDVVGGVDIPDYAVY